MISFSPVVLAQMRANAESLMSDTCTIEVGSDAVGEMGEVLSDQYAVVAADVSCRVLSLGSRFKESAGQVGEREIIADHYRLVCPYDTALAVDQRVTLTSDSSVWQVIDLVTERTSATDAQAVIVRMQG